MRTKCRMPGRYLLLALLFLGNTILSTHKFDLGIAILAMTGKSATVGNTSDFTSVEEWMKAEGNDSIVAAFPNTSEAVPTGGGGHREHQDAAPLMTTTMSAMDACDADAESSAAPVFSWSDSVQGVILGGYFYGVIIPQILGGRLAERFSAKWTLLAGLLASSSLTSATPWVARLGVVPLVVHRVVLGFIHGLSMPSSVALVARWAPRDERSTFVAVVFCGRYMGIVVATLLFGHLSTVSVAGGWPFAFYMSGLLGFVWLVLWYFLAFDDPTRDPKVTPLELRKIRSSSSGGSSHKADASKRRPLPWLAVLRSAPVWALVAARFTNMWVSMLLFTKLPAYVRAVLELPLHQNANFSSVVFAFTIVSMLGSGVLADCLLRCGLKTTLVRKVFQLIANFGPALCLLCLTVAGGSNQWLVLVLLVIGKVTLGAFTAGNAAAVVDVAPMYSATLNGMITTFGQTTGMLAPLVAGLLASSAQGDLVLQWNRIFYLSAAISFLGGLVFAAFGSAERQPWADPSFDKQSPVDRKSAVVPSLEEGTVMSSTALLATPASPDSEQAPAGDKS